MTDRELDALVAEKVMGWKPANGTSIRGWWTAPGGSCWTCDLPAYSTTGDGMLVVLDAMRARGFRFDMTHSSLDKLASASFASATLARGTALDEPPRAVCLAALRALGVEVPNV